MHGGVELRGQHHQFLWRAMWSVTAGCFRTMAIQDHGQRYTGPHIDSVARLLWKKGICYSVLNGYSKHTDTVQRPTAEVNLASLQPKQRYGKRLQIQRQIPGNHSQGKEKSNWGQKVGLGYNKMDMGRHSDLKSRNSTFKCRSTQAGP